MRLIPAIDIIDGKCVRLSQGKYSEKIVYNERPLEVAKMFEDAGLEYLHLVDLDGAKAKHIVNANVLEEIASKTALKVDFGGGIKSDDDVRIAFESGANQITGGSIAVNDPALFLSWLKRYGKDKIILGADAKDGLIAIQGWLQSSTIRLEDFIREFQIQGVEMVICTDIAKDGMLQGPAIDLYAFLIQRAKRENKSLKLIASGGVTTIEDLFALKKVGCEGAIIGKAIYENKITLNDLKKINDGKFNQ